MHISSANNIVAAFQIFKKNGKTVAKPSQQYKK